MIRGKTSLFEIMWGISFAVLLFKFLKLFELAKGLEHSTRTGLQFLNAIEKYLYGSPKGAP